MPESKPHSDRDEALRLARIWKNRPDVLQPSPEVSRMFAAALLVLEEQYNVLDQWYRDLLADRNGLKEQLEEAENHRRDNEDFIGRQQAKITGLLEQLEAMRDVLASIHDTAQGTLDSSPAKRLT